MDYDASGPAYIFPEHRIKEHDHIRLRIVSLTFHATDIVSFRFDSLFHSFFPLFLFFPLPRLSFPSLFPFSLSFLFSPLFSFLMSDLVCTGNYSRRLSWINLKFCKNTRFRFKITGNRQGRLSPSQSFIQFWTRDVCSFAVVNKHD